MKFCLCTNFITLAYLFEGIRDYLAETQIFYQAKILKVMNQPEKSNFTLYCSLNKENVKTDRIRRFDVNAMPIFNENSFNIVTIDETLDYRFGCISNKDGISHFASLFEIKIQKECYFDDKFYSMDEYFGSIVMLRLRILKADPTLSYKIFTYTITWERKNSSPPPEIYYLDYVIAVYNNSSFENYTIREGAKLLFFCHSKYCNRYENVFSFYSYLNNNKLKIYSHVVKIKYKNQLPGKMFLQQHDVNFKLMPPISEYKYVEVRTDSHLKYNLHIHTDFHNYRNFESNETCPEHNDHLKCNRLGEIVCRDPCKSKPPNCIEQICIKRMLEGNGSLYTVNKTIIIKSKTNVYVLLRKNKSKENMRNRSNSMITNKSRYKRSKECRKGWMGAYCASKTCLDLNPCINGQCQIGQNERSCSCYAKRYAGKYCEIDCMKICSCESCFLNKAKLECKCDLTKINNKDRIYHSFEEAKKNDLLFLAGFTVTTALISYLVFSFKKNKKFTNLHKKYFRDLSPFDNLHETVIEEIIFNEGPAQNLSKKLNWNSGSVMDNLGDSNSLYECYGTLNKLYFQNDPAKLGDNMVVFGNYEPEETNESQFSNSLIIINNL